ncbi:hypothetical protein GCK72_008045 [Caenorhabditis remanei]|uniref:Uncharacterized protein n=1 Tax=Caenorhabditis remanei TaxID=31234 RepID=A0A6A5HNB1_CAERE|nr:hypothetical protein GCK72_008045 [Caenorhabditis remanei]KAF1768084.1 hypothetical protein GCK72_008045 [Caenorhabditis remanei]
MIPLIIQVTYLGCNRRNLDSLLNSMPIWIKWIVCCKSETSQVAPAQLLLPCCVFKKPAGNGWQQQRKQIAIGSSAYLPTNSMRYELLSVTNLIIIPFIVQVTYLGCNKRNLDALLESPSRLLCCGSRRTAQVTPQLDDDLRSTTRPVPPQN